MYPAVPLLVQVSFISIHGIHQSFRPQFSTGKRLMLAYAPCIALMVWPIVSYFSTPIKNIFPSAVLPNVPCRSETKANVGQWFDQTSSIARRWHISSLRCHSSRNQRKCMRNMRISGRAQLIFYLLLFTDQFSLTRWLNSWSKEFCLRLSSRTSSSPLLLSRFVGGLRISESNCLKRRRLCSANFSLHSCFRWELENSIFY